MDLKRIEAAVKEILEAVGEDPNRPGLVETPKRVARMYEEIFAGLKKTRANMQRFLMKTMRKWFL